MKYSKELHDDYTETCYYSQKLHDWLRHKPFTRWYVDVLLDEIDRLQAERRWIPVSERLPEIKYDYLAVTEGARDKYGDVSVWIEVVEFYSECGHWGCGIDRFVTHWMPLPEPPDES